MKVTLDDGTVLGAIIERDDEPTELGTSLNKVLLQAIALQDRYYTIEDKTNAIPVTFSTNIVPAMSSTSANGYTVACGNWDEGNAYYPFDGNSSTRLYNSGAATSTITLTCPNYIKLTQVQYNCIGSTVQYLTVYGIEANGSRTQIGYYEGASTSSAKTYTVNITSSKHYNKFIFQYTGRGGIYTLSLSAGSYIVTDSPNTYLNITPEIALDSYKEGLKFNIQVPTNFNSNLLTTYIKLSGLDYVLLDGLIYAGKRYVIIYDGEKFILNT